MPRRILWLTVLAYVLVLSVGEGNVTKVNGSDNDAPLKMEIRQPPKEAVTDFFKAPLASFKAKMPLGSQVESVSSSIGKAENSTESTINPPFSNLWFNAGQSLGSAATSLTGWINNRLIPPAFTTTTTTTTSTTKKPAEVIVKVQTQPSKRKLVPINRKSPYQGERLRPHVYSIDDFEEDDDEDDEYNEETEYFNHNRFSNNEDSEQFDGDDEVFQNDDEEVYYEAPVKSRPQNTRRYKNRPRLNTNRRIYDEDDEEIYEDNDGSTKKEVDSSLLNRIKQLIQSSTKKKPEIEELPIKLIQIVEDLSSKTKKKNKKKKPSNDDSSYQLIPISEQQVLSLLQKQKKQPKKPETSQQFIIPLSQSSTKKGSKKPAQYLTIPLSQLGLFTSDENSSENVQQAEPIIITIPKIKKQENRKRRPMKTPSRKNVGGMRSSQKKRIHKEPLVAVLSQENIQELFKVPTIPPSRTPQIFENLPVTLVDKKNQPENEMDLENVTSPKPTDSPENAVLEDEKMNDDEDNDDDNNDDNEKEVADSFIIVGANDGTEVSLGRRFVQGGNLNRLFLRSKTQEDRQKDE